MSRLINFSNKIRFFKQNEESYRLIPNRIFLIIDPEILTQCFIL